MGIVRGDWGGTHGGGLFRQPDLAHPPFAQLFDQAIVSDDEFPRCLSPFCAGWRRRRVPGPVECAGDVLVLNGPPSTGFERRHCIVRGRWVRSLPPSMWRTGTRPRTAALRYRR